LKRAALLWLGFLALVCAFGGGESAYASELNKTLKVFTINIVVTPSPTPVGFIAPAHKQPSNIAKAEALTANPYGGPTRVALGPAAFDIPMLGPAAAPMVVAQSSPQGSLPVQFVAKPDPNATFLHFVPHLAVLNAGYGANSYTCVFEIYAFMTSTWKVVDWGYGTVSSGTGTFPIENLPSASDLSWSAEGVSTAFDTVYNGGSPGEVTFTGTANVSQQHCIDFKLTVPTSLAAGTYTAAIQYTLQYTF